MNERRVSERIDCAVIGAGVVGLAVARRLARAGREVVVLESAEAIGTGTSSRNSEVIHAGLYYPQGSLKARLCVAGRGMLYPYLAAHGVDHLKVGKLIVATEESEIPILRGLQAKGEANGCDDLRWLSAAEARAMEPDLICVAALLSPSTGIFDSHGYMLALQGEAEAAGAVFAFKSPVDGGAARDDGIHLRIGETELIARQVVNAAGLGAQGIARALEGFPAGRVPPLHYAKGNYFYLTGKAPFTRLVYPVPGTASLGLHYTRDLAGQGRFGPDVEWVETLDYQVDPRRADSFYAAIRRYWPGLAEGALRPGYSGIRPKIQSPDEPARDFLIEGPADHGISGLVQLFGIESPGLTASLAIAEHVAALLGAR